jgi:hypothetical protein
MHACDSNIHLLGLEDSLALLNVVYARAWRFPLAASNQLLNDLKLTQCRSGILPGKLAFISMFQHVVARCSSTFASIVYIGLTSRNAARRWAEEDAEAERESSKQQTLSFALKYFTRQTNVVKHDLVLCSVPTRPQQMLSCAEGILCHVSHLTLSTGVNRTAAGFGGSPSDPEWDEAGNITTLLCTGKRSVCGQRKQASDFPEDSRSLTGYHLACRVCIALRNAARRQELGLPPTQAFPNGALLGTSRLQHIAAHRNAHQRNRLYLHLVQRVKAS